MRPIEQVALIGLGAIGATYADKLYDALGEGFKVVLDPERIAQGAHMVTVNGRPRVFPVATSHTCVDLAIFAVKHHQLTEAMDLIAPLIGPHTVVLSLLNGISSEDMLAERFGADGVLYAMCVGIDALRRGREVMYTNFGRICFGEGDNSTISNRVRTVRGLFDRAQIPYEVPVDMVRTLWWKFMINVGVNQPSAVLRAPYGVFQEVAEARELMQAAMREVIAVAGAAGVALDDADIDGFMGVLASLSPAGQTSMLQDVEAGRKTEVEYLGGKVCALGKSYGVPTPVNQTLYQLIRALEVMHAPGGHGA